MKVKVIQPGTKLQCSAEYRHATFERNLHHRYGRTLMKSFCVISNITVFAMQGGQTDKGQSHEHDWLHRSTRYQYRSKSGKKIFVRNLHGCCKQSAKPKCNISHCSSRSLKCKNTSGKRQSFRTLQTGYETERQHFQRLCAGTGSYLPCLILALILCSEDARGKAIYLGYWTAPLITVLRDREWEKRSVIF